MKSKKKTSFKVPRTNNALFFNYLLIKNNGTKSKHRKRFQ